jgi:hypothetical protein
MISCACAVPIRAMRASISVKAGFVLCAYRIGPQNMLKVALHSKSVRGRAGPMRVDLIASVEQSHHEKRSCHRETAHSVALRRCL